MFGAAVGVKAAMTAPLFHATQKEPFSPLIQEVNVTPFHTASEENPISVLNEIDKLLARPFHYGICRLTVVAYPIVRLPVISEVIAENHSDVIKFKPLRRIHSADLIQPT